MAIPSALDRISTSTDPPSRSQHACREPEPHELNARICLFLLAAALLLAPTARAEPPPTIPGADAAIAKAESILGTDQFGPYGCEAFVAYAFGVPQARYGWDGASETMYQTLLKQGEIHTDMNPPRGALVFSKGSDRSPYRHSPRRRNVPIRRRPGALTGVRQRAQHPNPAHPQCGAQLDLSRLEPGLPKMTVSRQFPRKLS